ncbi:MAG: alpha/beta fold hydrolase [Acidithiobacillus sp.]|jgi:esterase/lipase|uniref:alpha/beta fold hydrolase n=1 Tax=Acidithiobacillus sp. TaxID=1872118 RepID=UPI00355D86A4
MDLLNSDECIFIPSKNSKRDLIFLHGYTSSNSFPDRVKNFFIKQHQFNIIACNSRGHGKRKNRNYENKEQVKQTVNEYTELIQERLKNGYEVNVIGNSMGASMALTLGNNIPEINKVFVIAGLNGKNMFDVPLSVKKKYEILFQKKEQDVFKPDILEAMPYNSNKCNKQNKKKYYFIHSLNDGVVPIHNMVQNMQELCLITNNEKNIIDNGYKIDTNENLLVLDTNSNIRNILSHVMPNFRNDVIQFINKNLK